MPRCGVLSRWRADQANGAATATDWKNESGAITSIAGIIDRFRKCHAQKTESLRDADARKS